MDLDKVTLSLCDRNASPCSISHEIFIKTLVLFQLICHLNGELSCFAVKVMALVFNECNKNQTRI